jgi:tripartite-type tricarboxylate transporter receptor subunit TctC
MTLLRICFAAIAVFGVAPVSAQQPGETGYPARTVRILVGNAPGGGIDITARVVAQKLTERLNRSFVVDNRPGASGIIAMEVAAKSPPDGYTLLVTSGSLISSANAQKKVTYDVRTAYAPVSQLASLYYMLLVTPALPARSVKELVALAKRRPGELNYGSSGIGGAGHLAAELFARTAGIKLVHVPYKGGGLVLTDLIVGQIQLGFTATISAMPHVRSGKLRALAVTSPQRSKSLPDFPTVVESGVPFELVNWYGLFAPAGTPPAVVLLLHQNVVQALASPDIESMLARDGAEAAPSATPAQFGAVLAKEVDRWNKIVLLPGFAEALR